ncbi:MAG: Dabb family protein [Cyanobacteria bacterium K_Offshore_surface_m2_239]|nr:Dabb family protein [Cyanobacteria bacterium K_Offshore_surface_m2_239]
MVHHLVLFRFRDDLPPEAIPAVFAELRSLREQIPGITGFSGGVDGSREGLTRGFTHGCQMTFVDAAARDAYLPHPEHQRVVERLLPLLEGGLDGALTFDFEDGVV